MFKAIWGKIKSVITLVDGWRSVLWRSWTVRLAFLSAFMSALEFAIPYFAPMQNNRWFALTALVVSLLAAFARIVSQPKLRKALGWPDSQQSTGETAPIPIDPAMAPTEPVPLSKPER